MAQERVFDAEAIEEYRQFLLGLIDQLEGQVVPVLGTGTLSRAPAFGTAPGAADAAGRYREFHAATWRNLQYLRGTLHGMEAALADIAGGGADADDEVTLAFADAEGTGSTSGGTTSDAILLDGSGTALVDGGSGFYDGTGSASLDTGGTALTDGGGGTDPATFVVSEAQIATAEGATAEA
ncbi:hypothetical protein [Glycomyces terrestris]|uniref:Uncharacterized protein n=1 Tax=Glycomyces terrestris TaxID=2493553 RepID=A0A426URZ7_9ACTN|nr:hypothetical protein [Glycomyces terrestris]RRR96071.1 hypothetical protein EIW28_22675 [Glycomyces terrestris]